MKTIGLLGGMSMEQDFDPGAAGAAPRARSDRPEPEAREIVHRVIYDELCRG